LPGEDSHLFQHSTQALPFRTFGNGIVGVFIVNELTTPNSTIANDIDINVFISAGDDFEVFVPDDHFQKFVLKPQQLASNLSAESTEVEPQSGTEIVPDSQDTQEPSAPEHSMSDNLGPGILDTHHINKVFTGESIMSFRTLLKRYNLWRREKTNIGTSPNYTNIKVTKCMYPFYRGKVSGAVDQGVASAYNYVNTVLLHWVTVAFSGWRGSIRYKLMFDKCYINNAANTDSRVYITREPVFPFGQSTYSRVLTNNTFTFADEGSSRKIIAGNTKCTGTKGMLYATDKINPVVEFEVPYYSQYRFTPGKLIDYTEDVTWTPNWSMEADVFSNGLSVVDYHVAAGEDYQVYFFTGLPRMYYEATPLNP